MSFATDGAERTLSVGLGQHADGVDVADVLSGMFAGTPEQVGSIDWGTRSYPVVVDGVTYGVAALAGEVDDFLGQNVDSVFEAQFGGSGSGDTTLFGQSTVLAEFESFALGACAFDEYIAAVSNPDVTIVD